MAKPFDYSQLGLIEDKFLPRYLFNFSLFGYQFKLAYAKRRWPNKGCQRVAIVVHHHENAWSRRTIKGFINAISNGFAPDEAPQFDIFSADASADNIKKQIMPDIMARRGEYSLIVTIGTWASKQVREAIQASDLSVPQIFLGVHDPVAAGLVASTDIPEKGIFGVTSAVIDYGRAVRVLKMIRPDIKTVLMPYDQNFVHEGFHDERKRLAHHLERIGVQIRTLTIDLHEDVAEQLRPHLQNIDVVWSMREAAMQINARKVAKLCKEMEVTFCASDLASVFQGAGIGWGDSGSVVGAYGGLIGFAVCTGAVNPDRLVNFEVNHAHAMRVNPNYLEHQGIDLDKKSQALINEIVPLGWE